MDSNYFANTLLSWYSEHRRDLPWRNTEDPYALWISEIILQQTRVNQGIEYYYRFMEQLPTVQALSEAPEQEVLKLWEGLGYYSRARNLHAAAQQIMSQYQGVFPRAYEQILSLKGVGEYTAGAIASFAYNLPHPAVDGNVFRVLTRILGIDTPIDSSAGKKVITHWARHFQPADQAGTFNQALIEFGALQCSPKKPDCITCPFLIECQARNEGNIEKYPVKKGKTVVKALFLYYFILETPAGYIVEQRKGGGIWENLYQFPVFESSEALAIDAVLEHYFEGSKDWTIKDLIHPPIHKLSHRSIDAHFIVLDATPSILKHFPKPTSRNEIAELPFPKLISPIIEQLLAPQFPTKHIKSLHHAQTQETSRIKRHPK